MPTKVSRSSLALAKSLYRNVGDGVDMAGPSERLHGLEAAIALCERALECLDVAGLFSEGAGLSFALDRLRQRRDELRAAADEG